LTKIHDVYIPPVGPDDADIMVVGEAGGKDEEEQKEPFVGKSGNLLDRYGQRNGLRRERMFLTNLCKYRPYGNKFNNLLGSDKLSEGLEELAEEIKRVNPKVIFAAGGWPMYYLTGQCGEKNKKPSPGSGILTRRGSVFPCTLVDDGPKVVCSLHPAYILRNWKWNPVFNDDLSRLARESVDRDLHYPEYELLVDPPDIGMIVDEMCEAEWLSIDIETFAPGEMSCFGVCDSENRVLVITFKCPQGWEYAEQIVRSPAKKIAQYGTYDKMFIEYFYGWTWQNFVFDTYIAAAHLMPAFPRRLDFLASIYTDFPYYKEERKRWRREMDLDLLWSYNGKDVIATWQIAFKQMKELEDHYDTRIFNAV